jgi:hypothetical protein
VADPSEYRSLAGALQYLTLTRPYLAYAIQQVCLLMYDPQEPHLALIKRILRYVKGTLSVGLHIGVGFVDLVTAYSDADWASCPDTRRSTSDYCIYLYLSGGGGWLIWCPDLRNDILRFGYRGVAHAVA